MFVHLLAFSLSVYGGIITPHCSCTGLESSWSGCNNLIIYFKYNIYFFDVFFLGYFMSAVIVIGICLFSFLYLDETGKGAREVETCVIL